uniref:Uncharacterized protein n=1 Tax=Heterorhabditis bacteriophora TaxID=37862 RepID=A0A1I7WSM8_HETBA
MDNGLNFFLLIDVTQNNLLFLVVNIKIILCISSLLFKVCRNKVLIFSIYYGITILKKFVLNKFNLNNLDLFNYICIFPWTR